MSWSWKTKPRSIIKTIQWFPYFAKLEGENWDKKALAVSKKDAAAIHPVRRSYIYAAHSDEDAWLSSLSYRDYLSGQKDKKETEANGRMDKGAYEFFGFGYVKEGGTIAVTEVGNKIVQGTFDAEDYLKQLLKIRLPNHVYNKSRIKEGKFLFPMQIVLRAFETYESLNRSELALMFGCNDTEEIPKTIEAIGIWKERYDKLENKNDTAKVKELFCEIFEDTYGGMENKADSYYDYAEALSRTLLYTGLFSASGRSLATKIRVARHSRSKVEMLQTKYEFFHPEPDSLDDYMQWFGCTHNVRLPWENPEERKKIIVEKANLYLAEMEEAGEAYQAEAKLSLADVRQIVADTGETSDAENLKAYERDISDAIVSRREDYFIKVASRTEEERQQILDKFDDILANEDMSALWLEVNTWKSLIAINGKQTVKRNFKVEEDLTPKSFAPGVGNTPDMELYQNGYVIIPEVSLMTGVRQWEHEASSVIDHVLSFIKDYADKQVIGLFLSSRIHTRTAWQFFILNRESWVGAPVPVIPLTIEQYIEIIEHIYRNEKEIDDFKTLLDRMRECAKTCENYELWKDEIAACITDWKQEKVEETALFSGDTVL